MKILDSLTNAKHWSGNCVATIGKYDGMHLGHQRILDALLVEAANRNLPAVVILSEPQPEEFFAGAEAPPRLNHFRDKVDFLAGYGVDAVYHLQFDQALSQQSAGDFVQRFLVAGLGLRSLVIGDDFRFGRNRGGDMTLLQRMGSELGYRVTSVAPCRDADERVSSTLVRQCLQGGDCDRVLRLLGRPYSISGTVIRGRQLGRQLGVPTANVELLTTNLPMMGVFMVRAGVAGRLLQGVASLGFNPTIADGLAPALEVHLLDFNGDIYGERMQVHFLRKLRNEEKFAGLPELLTQIRLDIAQARAGFAQSGAGELVQ